MMYSRIVLRCKKKMKAYLLFCLRPFIFLYQRVVKKTIIVMIDGGICSQMSQYLMAKIFIDKGYDVEYDLTFFQHGTDMDGIQVRCFDLTKAFPYIKVKKTSVFKRYIYMKFYSYMGSFPLDDSGIWTKLTPPVILLGYYGIPSWYFNDFNNAFHLDPSVLDPDNLSLYNSIPEESVAIHVRRGDLANVTDGNYGAPVSEKYLLDSIVYLNKRLHSPVFYFFSDGMDYVKEKIISQLDTNIKFHLVNNGSDKGYCDMFLISKCSHQITSKGSLGKYGACLNPNKGIVIIAKDDKQLGPLINANKEIIRF